MNRLITFIAAALVGLMAIGVMPSLASAQGGRSGGHKGHHHPRNDMTDAQRAEALEKIKALRVYQLTEILELEGEQSQSFFSLLAKYDDQTSEYMRTRRDAHHALKKAVGAEQRGETVDAETFLRLVEDVYARDAAAEAVRAEFMAEAKAILSPSQLARFVLYQKEFERRLRHEIMRISRGDGSDKDGSLKGLKGREDLVQ